MSFRDLYNASSNRPYSPAGRWCLHSEFKSDILLQPEKNKFQLMAILDIAKPPFVTAEIKKAKI